MGGGQVRITYCSENSIRTRVELLLYLCGQFESEHNRIINAAREIEHYLDTYGSALDPDFRKRAYTRVKAVLEKSLHKEVSPERISYYLDFCSKTGKQPLGADSLAKLIAACPEKTRPVLLFKLGGLYITSFGSPGRGWDIFRGIMENPETGLSWADSLYAFCSNHRYYIEGARMLAGLVEHVKQRERLDILLKISALYRTAGETDKALEYYEKITGMEPDNAACWYERILQHHADPGTYLEYAYALCLSGRYGRAESLRKSLNKKTLAGQVRFKGNKTSLISGLKALSEEFSVQQEQVHTGIPPVKGWTDIVLSADRILCRGRNTYNGYVRPPCIPAVAGNMLYFYTGVILRAYNIRTGKHCWSVRVRTGSRTLTETPVLVFRVLVYGDRVYVRVPGGDYSLNAYSRDSGKHVWSSSREPGLGGLHVTGEPALINGMIVFTAARLHKWGRITTNTELFCAALSPDTGKLLWKQLLVSGESGYGDENVSRHLPRALETDHGIFIQTNRKVFQMLDPLSGSIEWVLRGTGVPLKTAAGIPCTKTRPLCTGTV